MAEPLRRPPARRPRSSSALHAETAKALQDPEVQQSFRGAGVEPASSAGQELERFIRAEYEKWGKVVRDTGATVN